MSQILAEAFSWLPARLKPFADDPLVSFGVAGVGWLLPKLAERFFKNRDSRRERGDDAVCKLVETFEGCVVAHFNAWIGHQRAEWESMRTSRDNLEKLSREARLSRMCLKTHLKPKAAQLLESVWTHYIGQLTGDLGLITKKSEKHASLENEERALQAFQEKIGKLKRDIRRGGMTL